MIFLDRNAIEIHADEDAIYDVWVALAGGRMTEVDLANWLEDHARPASAVP